MAARKEFPVKVRRVAVTNKKTGVKYIEERRYQYDPAKGYNVLLSSRRTGEKILEGVWGKNYFGDVKIVDVNIRRLRMKVEDEPSHPTHIMTVWGYGYRWEE